MTSKLPGKKKKKDFKLALILLVRSVTRVLSIGIIVHCLFLPSFLPFSAAGIPSHVSFGSLVSFRAELWLLSALVAGLVCLIEIEPGSGSVSGVLQAEK